MKNLLYNILLKRVVNNDKRHPCSGCCFQSPEGLSCFLHSEIEHIKKTKKYVGDCIDQPENGYTYVYKRRLSWG